MRTITDLYEEFDMYLTMYKVARDSEEILNSDYFDAISFDIEGFDQSFIEAEMNRDFDEMKDLIDKIKVQVSNASKLIIAMKNMTFIFG